MGASCHPRGSRREAVGDSRWGRLGPAPGTSPCVCSWASTWASLGTPAGSRASLSCWTRPESPRCPSRCQPLTEQLRRGARGDASQMLKARVTAVKVHGDLGRPRGRWPMAAVPRAAWPGGSARQTLEPQHLTGSSRRSRPGDQGLLWPRDPETAGGPPGSRQDRAAGLGTRPKEAPEEAPGRGQQQAPPPAPPALTLSERHLLLQQPVEGQEGGTAAQLATECQARPHRLRTRPPLPEQPLGLVQPHLGKQPDPRREATGRGGAASPP